MWTMLELRGNQGKKQESEQEKPTKYYFMLLHANMKIKKWVYSGDRVGKIDMGDLNGKLDWRNQWMHAGNHVVSRRRCFSVCCQNQSLSYEEEVSDRA